MPAVPTPKLTIIDADDYFRFRLDGPLMQRMPDHDRFETRRTVAALRVEDQSLHYFSPKAPVYLCDKKGQALPAAMPVVAPRRQR